ncbi:MAG: hypothetical protein ACRCUY_03740 [Thermoguttaceae bacterium]
MSNIVTTIRKRRRRSAPINPPTYVGGSPKNTRRTPAEQPPTYAGGSPKRRKRGFF